MLTNIGGGWKKGTQKDGRDHLIINPEPQASYPKMLQSGEYVSVWIDDLSILNDSLEFLDARDSLGRSYKLRGHRLKQLVAEGKTIPSRQE